MASAQPPRPTDARTRTDLLYVAIGVLVAIVLAADLVTPMGVAVWVFYLAPLTLCLYTRSPVSPIVVGLIATALITLTTFTDPAGIDPAVALPNRIFGIAMIGGLTIIVRQLLISRLAAEREAWLRSSQGRLFEELQGELRADEVGRRTLATLAQLIDVQVAAFYTVDGGVARLTASLALDRGRAPASYAAGEGLIGHALEDSAITRVDDLEDDSFRLEAGVASRRPRHLLVAPMWVDGAAVAVAALGSQHRLDERAEALLRRCVEGTALATRTAMYRSRLRELLEETQRQAEELRAQQDEVLAFNEELAKQAASLMESQTQLEEQQAELEQANAQLEMQASELEAHKEELETARDLADRANRHKSEFLANMSHELRTPLNSALILARLLADNRAGNLTGEQVKHAEAIYSAGNDLLSLINDILDLSKIEAGRIDLEIAQLTPARIVAPLEATFAPLAQQKGLGFRIEVPDHLPEMRTDARRVQQVLTNLLSNAIKFTSRGEVVLRVASSSGGVRFAVSDTGIGIAPADQQAIFEPFQQADGTISRKFGGTGLGLSIARDLTAVLGGRLEVDSAPGRGSTFVVVLPVIGGAPLASTRSAPVPAVALPFTPLARALPAPPPLPDDRDKRTRKDRLILVVEDDPAFARILYDLAHELDFDCVLAGTADEGLRLAGELTPTGILLDVGLPDGSGMTVLERLKRQPATRHIPVHVLSVSDFSRVARELGAVGYAIKPVRREQLSDAIRGLEQKLRRDGRRVLVVEDDEIQRESTCALLAADGVELHGAATMAEALDALATHTYDCMVLDLGLPDGSGHALLEQLASGEQYSFPPVVVYTGREIDQDDERRLRRYSQSIIVKGVRSPERLLGEVTLFLHQIEAELPPERQRMLFRSRQREAAFEGRRILLVEDDIRNVFALTSVLEPRGASIEIARNGREAVDRLGRAPRPDIVLMDIMMPEMDGLTATREIRKLPGVGDVPIIALTAKAMRDDQQRCLAAGANDYMAKPIDVEKLLSLCRVWMPRSSA